MTSFVQSDWLTHFALDRDLVRLVVMPSQTGNESRSFLCVETSVLNLKTCGTEIFVISLINKHC
jgi:hypothetical protein